MKLAGLRIFGFIGVLALATLACAAVPSMDSLLNPLPKDDFSSDTSGWGTGTDSDKSVEYSNGGLHMTVNTPFYVTWSTPSLKVYENVHIEASVTNASTDPQAMFGIICDEMGATSNFYYVGVNSKGYYAFIKSTLTEKDVYLKEGTSDVIASASANSMRLGLDCSGGTLTLYVNGQKIDSVSDATYTSGGVGLFAANDDVAGGTDAIFDDFAMKKLSK
jgi:hypothetical protein